MPVFATATIKRRLEHLYWSSRFAPSPYGIQDYLRSSNGLTAPPTFIRAMILGAEIIGRMTSKLKEYECVGECRDRRLAAVFTTRFASSFVAS